MYIRTQGIYLGHIVIYSNAMMILVDIVFSDLFFCDASGVAQNDFIITFRIILIDVMM